MSRVRPTEAVLGSFMAAWNAHDVDRLMDHMTEDCVFLASAGPHPEGAEHRGPADVRSAYHALLETFSDARWSEDVHFGDEQRGVSEWMFRGTTHAGEPVEVKGCDLFVMRQGRIVVKDSFRKQRVS